MEVIILKDHEEVSAYATEIFIQTIKKKKNAVLGFGTGSTPIRLYEMLVEAYKSKKVNFKGVSSFNLDEYVGLKKLHPQCYRAFMNENLFNHIDINKKNTYFPECHDGKNLIKIGNGYERLIKQKKGIDIQLLGIGDNGHIAFNEPSSSLSSRTRVKTLTPETISANSIFFKGESYQPKLAITMGIGTIMEAKHIILLATGAKKADIVASAVEGPVSAFCPASILQFHNGTKIIIDEAAASKLKLKNYYVEMRNYQKELLEKFGKQK